MLNCSDRRSITPCIILTEETALADPSFPTGQAGCRGGAATLLPVVGHNGSSACFDGDLASETLQELQAPPRSKGTFLKHTIVLQGAAGQALVSAVLEDVSSSRISRRKRQASEIENERELLRCVLANGLSCHWHRACAIVSFQRKADASFYKARNRPPWLSANALGRAVQALVAIGLARLWTGYRGTSSGYELTEKLLQQADALGVTEHSLGIKFCDEDLVRLKGPRPRPVFDTFTATLVRQDADRIYFEPTSQTEAWRAGLANYNEFVGSQVIDVQPTQAALAAWVAKLNEQRGTGSEVRRPELYRCSLYRVFNDGDVDAPNFDKGGRLVGAWWLNAPGDVRSLIRINEEPTVELDYTACHPRMLYHELGLEAPDDPYYIPEVAALEAAEGSAVGAYRSTVKWQFQLLINGGNRPDLVATPDDVRRPKEASFSDIRRFIRGRHQAISSAFQSRAGLRLMNTEAAIAFSIIEEARQRGWLALPVHDAFIAAASREEELRAMMIEEYRIRLGKEPIITKKDSR